MWNQKVMMFLSQAYLKFELKIGFNAESHLATLTKSLKISS
jgi:hypothetical protein